MNHDMPPKVIYWPFTGKALLVMSDYSVIFGGFFLLLQLHTLVNTYIMVLGPCTSLLEVMH